MNRGATVGDAPGVRMSQSVTGVVLAASANGRQSRLEAILAAFEFLTDISAA